MAYEKNLYLIQNIAEADFGCEGRPESEDDRVSVQLVGSMGDAFWIDQSDNFLNSNRIIERDVVRLINSDKKYKYTLERKFHLREVIKEDFEQALKIEQTCFPPNEACTAKAIYERIEKAKDTFLVAEDLKNECIFGFINGIVTDEEKFRDEFFSDISLHYSNGKNVMICGVDVLPGYRNLGIASLMMQEYITVCKRNNRTSLILTNHEKLTGFYKKLGYEDLGLADSSWGGETWHEMKLKII